ncbi:MAG: hypothetical protein ACE5HW_04410, partial [Candidatus Methanofastidiosia archaeon]
MDSFFLKSLIKKVARRKPKKHTMPRNILISVLNAIKNKCGNFEKNLNLSHSDFRLKGVLV